MFYDPETNILYDTETGAEIPILDDVDYPEEIKRQIQSKKDHDFALSLSSNTSGKNSNDRGGYSSRGKKSTNNNYFMEEEERGTELVARRHQQQQQQHNYGHLPGDGEMKLQQELIELRMHEAPENPMTSEINGEITEGGGWMDDFTLARALQAMEFEIAGETLDRGDFDEKEYRASSCKRQLLTISTLILLTQIGMLIAMVQDDGYAPRTENPLMGPPATTLVRYGAKEAGLILYRGEWWRLISPIFLHAGVLHILSNGIIQLRVGGYLNRVFGTLPWLFIYFASGIFGNMLSCIFLPDAIGVGSSGALMGMLSAWLIWIVFRWKKIPDECKNQRNCQLLMVTAAIALTLVFSFSKYVDWGAHFGGTIQGVLSGVLVLTRELDNVYSKWGLRILSLIMFGISFGWALYTMTHSMEPSKENFELYDENDDWGR